MHNPVLDDMAEYAFDRLRALLKDVTPPAGLDPIIMSLGEPNHEPPDIISRTVAGHGDKWGRYPPTAGAAAHLEACAGWLERRYGLPGGLVDPARHVCAAMGSRESLYMAGDVCIPQTKNGGRPVVAIPNPFYQAYYGAAKLNGAEVAVLSGSPAGGYLPDFSELSGEQLRRTAMVYLCTPSNPQGTAAGLDYLSRAVELAREHDFVLAVDECYAEIYLGEPTPGILQACAAAGGGLENVLTFNSLSKRSSSPGLRSGFVAGDEGIISRLKRLRAYGGATIPAPLAEAATALWNDDAHVEANRALYREKFDRADEILAGVLGYYRPDGGFFLWLEAGDGEEAARRLWAEAAVRVVPGAYVGLADRSGVNPGDGRIRVALVDDPATVAEGLTRIRNTLAS